MQHPALNNPHVSPENSSEQWLKTNLFFLSYTPLLHPCSESTSREIPFRLPAARI